MTGVDFRALSNAIVARLDDSTLWLGRGAFEPSVVEQRFRNRLWADGSRLSRHPELVRVSGRIGTSFRTLLLLGGHTAAAVIGSPRLADAVEAYALDRLRTPPALETPALADLLRRLEEAPLALLAPGPFEGEWAYGARGLFEAAVAMGFGLRPLNGARVTITAVVLGDWSIDGSLAMELLLASWNDFAHSPLGRLLTLDRPLAGPDVVHDPEALSLTIELDAQASLKGLEQLVNLRLFSTAPFGFSFSWASYSAHEIR